MLVLTRGRQESILIGDVRVTVIQVGRGKVRIGIEAPKDTPVMRAELVEDEQDDTQVEE